MDSLTTGQNLGGSSHLGFGLGMRPVVMSKPPTFCTASLQSDFLNTKESA
jgi:hypothetical protein